MVKINPMQIQGRWRKGYALEIHTLSSVYIGDDEYGHPQFDTTRTELGELIYRLKNQSDRSVIDEIVEAAAQFYVSWQPGADSIVPVPASRIRGTQPVMLMGEPLAERLGLPFATNWLHKVKDVPELKNVYNYDKRIHLLEGAHEVDRSKVEGRRILLFDDLYRSGATMNTITEVLYDHGAVADVFALTITRTRSNR